MKQGFRREKKGSQARYIFNMIYRKKKKFFAQVHQEILGVPPMAKMQKPVLL